MLLPVLFYLFYWLMSLAIFLWQMLWPHIIAQCGVRCYCQVAGGKATVGWVGILSTEYGKENVKIFC